MSFAVTVKDAQDLRKLIPLNILSANRFDELCTKTSIEEGVRGVALFHQGDVTNEFVYVLSGTVSLQAGGMEMETITGGTESARFALAHQIPRKVSAVAKDRIRYIRVDSAYVNQPNENIEGKLATYEVSDIPDDSTDDWVTALLKSPVFQFLPPANLQNILSLLEEMPVRAGQEIVRQGEMGDYYYIVKRGRCVLTRKPSRLAKEVKLAELKTADTFGEDSLISDQPRSVNVTMLTDGTLLRLSKANFLKLVKEPVIHFVNMEAVQNMLAQGARWLDVRSSDSFAQGHLPGAINIPFFTLRMELPTLSHKCPYVLLCETGKVSEAAAFLMIRHEFDVFVLTGGISGIFKDQLTAGAEQSAVVDEVQPAGIPEGADTTDSPSSAGEEDLSRDGDEARTASSVAGESDEPLRDRLHTEGVVPVEASRRLNAPEGDVARLREPGPSPEFLENVRLRLAEAEAAKATFERQMQARLQAMEERHVAVLGTLRTALRAANNEKQALEQALAGSRAEIEQLQAQLAQWQSSAAEDTKVVGPMARHNGELEQPRGEPGSQLMTVRQSLASNIAGIDEHQGHGKTRRWRTATDGLFLFGMLILGAALVILLMLGTDTGRRMTMDMLDISEQRGVGSNSVSP